MKKSFWFLIILIVFISACQLVAPKPPEELVIVFGEIEKIERIDSATSYVWPGEVKVVVSGYLPDGCTEIDEVTSDRIGHLFNIRIFTKQEKRFECIPAEMPFETTVLLDISELDYGKYRVQAYDSFDTFEPAIPPEPIDSYG